MRCGSCCSCCCCCSFACAANGRAASLHSWVSNNNWRQLLYNGGACERDEQIEISKKYGKIIGKYRKRKTKTKTIKQQIIELKTKEHSKWLLALEILFFFFFQYYWNVLRTAATYKVVDEPLPGAVSRSPANSVNCCNNCRHWSGAALKLNTSRRAKRSKRTCKARALLLRVCKRCNSCRLSSAISRLQPVTDVLVALHKRSSKGGSARIECCGKKEQESI